MPLNKVPKKPHESFHCILVSIYDKLENDTKDSILFGQSSHLLDIMWITKIFFCSEIFASYLLVNLKKIEFVTINAFV